ncbi:MAG: glycogen debranching N-terminal domain-containing protein [Actinomycetes bacterium]
MPGQADPPSRQPLLHDLVSTIAAPTTALSGADGQIRHIGAQGLFHADRRALSLARLLVDGKEPEPVSAAVDGAARSRFVSLPRWLDGDSIDPTVRIDRTRTVTPGGMSETIEISSAAARPITAEVSVELGCDLAPIERVKPGGNGTALPAETAGDGRLRWRDDGITVEVHGPDAHARPGPAPTLTWAVTLAPRQRVTLTWSVRVTDPDAVMAAPADPAEWTDLEVTAADHRLTRLLARSLDDLRALRLTEAGTPPGHTFIGAGVPWYLTLFGRDSLWTARMMLPLGTELAEGTLRTLARRQGMKVDKRTGEAPGKIMHELRRGLFVLGESELPAAYYGTIDATLLWINLLHDAWRWGMPEDRVAGLLPALEAALGWLAEYADPDGDGFVEYIDEDGRGLANQGWKDSGDAMRFHDGSQAEPPIALAEVQGYAFEAARNGAALLDAFGRPGATRWRDYAAAMAERFRDRFWVDGPHGRHPALALDAAKRPVDSLTSNIGHLLGTGMLTDAETEAIAALLVSPAMAGGYGLRTMSARDKAFNPLSYHCGSIWTHDTAIVVDALARAGRGRESALLARSLLDAAELFDYRLPELYSGDDRAVTPRPVPYPAACRPQAWSAAAAVCLVRAALGVEPDVPGGRVTFRPLPDAPFGPLTVRGLRIAGSAVDVTVRADGGIEVSGLPAGLRVETP